MPDLTGTYLHLQRLSTEDGPGIRTTVFLKGCLLRCKWCHNPESLLPDPQVQRVETNCIQCGTCIPSCPKDALKPGDDFVLIDRDHCDGCGICVEACPAGALELLGSRISVDDIFAELVKDLSYFQKTDGGVTFSGGEPALQADFCAALMGKLRSVGINTALDTCGMTSQGNLAKVLPHTDIVLYDLKEMDPALHKAHTGQSNQVVLRNLLYVRDFIQTSAPDTRLWIRTPLIPNATTTRENLMAIGAFLAEHLDGIVERWELPAFNNLCRDKYRRLGMRWEYESTPLLTDGELEQMGLWGRESGFQPNRVMVTGLPRPADPEEIKP